MTTNIAKVSAIDPVEWSARLRALPPPHDYYSGVEPFLPVPPAAVTAFARSGSVFAEQPSLHHRFLLVTSFAGRGGVLVNERMIVLEPGCSLLVFPYQSHHYVRLQPGDIDWAFVGFELAGHAPLEPLRDRTFRLTDESVGQLSRILDDCAGWQGGGGPRHGPAAHRLAILLGEAVRIVGRPAASGPGAASPYHALVERVARHVHAHIARPVSIGEVAARVGVSASHLRRTFAGALGMSLGRFIREARMRHACQLLAGSDQRIGEIAEACGFTSPFIFSRAFRVAVGLCPRDYRKRACLVNLTPSGDAAVIDPRGGGRGARTRRRRGRRPGGAPRAASARRAGD